MRQVGISEFLHLTKLTKDDLIVMLENGELPISIGPTNEVLIDIESLSPERLAQRSLPRANNNGQHKVVGQDLLEETVAAELMRAMDTILDDALQMTVNWLQQKNSPAGSSEDR